MRYLYGAHATLHSPVQIERMTGLSCQTQFNWRTRGLLRRGKGPKAHLDTWEVGALAVRSWATKLGFPASKNEALGEDAKASVIYFALMHGAETLETNLKRAAHRQFQKDFLTDDTIARDLAGLRPREAPIYAIGWIDDESPRLLRHQDDECDFEDAIAIRKINLVELGDRLAREASGVLFRLRFERP